MKSKDRLGEAAGTGPGGLAEVKMPGVYAPASGKQPDGSKGPAATRGRGADGGPQVLR